MNADTFGGARCTCGFVLSVTSAPDLRAATMAEVRKQATEHARTCKGRLRIIALDSPQPFDLARSVPRPRC